MDTQSLVVSTSAAQSWFLTRVFGWMSLALAVTAATSFGVAATPALVQLIVGNPWAFWGLLILELVTVVYLTRNLGRMSLATAQGAFLGYAVVNGLTLSLIFLVYTAGSLASTFVVTAGMFGATAAYGYFTKADLSRWGSVLLMGLFGLILAGVVNLFWANSALYWLTTVLGILIFTGLTAYDLQRLKRLRETAAEGTGDVEEAEGKLALLGALLLYLDFINMFLYLLRLLGRRK